jgi:hypothetical protein
MPAVQTHHGRRPLLAAALWASAYALLGCTDGIAQPILPISVAGARSFAGRGAAGQQAVAGRSAADGGVAGSRADAGTGTKSMCEQLAAMWSPEQMDAENALRTALNEAIRHMQNCVDRQFTRQQFQKSEVLTCEARLAARGFELHGGMPFGKLPSMQGPSSRDPFSPAPDMDQIAKFGFATYQDASDAILDDPDDCAKLMTGKYTSAGFGHFGTTWVVALGSN